MDDPGQCNSTGHLFLSKILTDGKQFCNENRIRILLTSNSLNRSVMGQSCSTVLHTDCQADSQTEVGYLHHSFT